MTALAEETALFPAELFSQDFSASVDDWGRGGDCDSASWLVFHTKPRAEKSLARHLLAQETPFFLPLHRKVVRRQGRTVRSFLPLFPGYVFALATSDQRYAAMTTNRIVNCIPVNDEKRLYSDLFRVHQLVESELPLSSEEEIELGTPAEIVGGPLRGQRGKVVRRSSGMRLVVEVDFLQSGVSVEVESDDIRMI